MTTLGGSESFSVNSFCGMVFAPVVSLSSQNPFHRTWGGVTRNTYVVENCHVGNDIARDSNFDGHRCCTNVAPQSELGVLSKRRYRINPADPADIGLDWPSADWAVEHFQLANTLNRKIDHREKVYRLRSRTSHHRRMHRLLSRLV